MDKKSNLSSILGSVQSKGNAIKNIEIDDLCPFGIHPFKLYTESKMREMVDSIKKNGILNPLLVRPIQNGKYEIIAGHNRWEAAKQANLEEVPVIIKDVDDDAAAIMMVDTNFNQREEILLSEKAFAYKIKLEAIKKQGIRGDLTCDHGEHKLKKSRDIVAEEAGESAIQISRYIRLTKLIPNLLEKVDSGELNFIPAVDISYLTHEQQGMIEDIMNIGKVKPTKIQAAVIKKLSQDGELTKQEIRDVLMGKKDEEFSSWKVQSKQFKKLLPQKLQKEITPAKADEIFEEAMQLWLKKHGSEYEN